MFRIIVISIVSLALTACDKTETNKPPTENGPAQQIKDDNHVDRKDMEHQDKEHHGSIKDKEHIDSSRHKDDENHESHEDKEHHGEKKKDDSGHDHEGGESGGHEEEGTVYLKPAQMKAANIVVEALALTDVAARVRAPGEIKLNAYRTIKVSPRISAEVTARHAKLGDEVIQGQALVTLSSVEMAEAQGQLLLADKEWKRVKKLGRKVVAERRYITAKVEYEKSYANAKAFGMSGNEINDLLAQKRSADGSFKLVAKQAGRILHDKFIVGERVEAGYELMVIADESVMWVEARVRPDIAGQIDIGNAAEIVIDEKRVPAKVVQLHHILDEVTRTAAVRLEVDNKEDRLHAGMFVTTFITTRHKKQGIQLPEAAVLRSPDGDWQVMVEQDEPGQFKAQEVKLKSVSDGVAVIEGKLNNIRPGIRVVTQGAFFVQSELAKSGFDPHNH